jgi:cytochrome c peroxidase
MTVHAVLVALVFAGSAFGGSPYEWSLPRGFTKPVVPADNPMTIEKVELGRFLFYDARMSVNGTTSCGTCHRQELAFTDGKPVALGATGESHTRNSMSLVNLAYASVLTWANPEKQSLETQMLTPMFGTHPVELGMDRVKFLRIVRNDPTYQRLFRAAYGETPAAFSLRNVIRAIACFERTITSAGSSYDRYHFGEAQAISPAAKRGEVMFFLDGKESCFRCHGGLTFTDGAFHNTGISPADTTLQSHTHSDADRGKFRVPSLRNVALTAPYMHDGSIADLSTVIDHYAATPTTPNEDPLIRGFAMSARNKADLIAFLQSLTDEALIHDERFSDPWPVVQSAAISRRPAIQ